MGEFLPHLPPIEAELLGKSVGRGDHAPELLLGHLGEAVPGGAGQDGSLVVTRVQWFHTYLTVKIAVSRDEGPDSET